jgi:hypothetical protein
LLALLGRLPLQFAIKRGSKHEVLTKRVSMLLEEPPSGFGRELPAAAFFERDLFDVRKVNIIGIRAFSFDHGVPDTPACPPSGPNFTEAIAFVSKACPKTTLLSSFLSRLKRKTFERGLRKPL